MTTQEYIHYTDIMMSAEISFDTLDEYTQFYNELMKKPMLLEQQRTLSAIYNSHMMLHPGDTDDKVDRPVSGS